MGISRTNDRMEGWLYLFRQNRFGLQYSRKRYFYLNENYLKSFKSIPVSEREEPAGCATIDSCIRVADNGRESFHKKELFIFTLFSTSSPNEQLKLGASSPEEAARWIHSVQNAALKGCSIPEKNLVACPKRRWQLFRLGGSRRTYCKNSVDWTLSPSMHMDAVTSDVIAPSPWKICGCQNGLRIFKESKDRDSSGAKQDDHPAVMAVGTVDGTPEAIFWTLMSLGPSRSEWDYSFCRGSVVEHLDGHTDIVHKLLYRDWLPWGMKRRDLLLRRYWRREDDGTYVILYHSVCHKKCPPQRSYIRACLKSGGYVITPINQGKQSLVKHMLAIDWKFWKSYVRTTSARSITICMLERVAALREMFKAKTENYLSEFSSGELMRDIVLPQIDIKGIKTGVQGTEQIKMIKEDDLGQEEVEKPISKPLRLMGMNDASDEFFDVPEPSDDVYLENEWSPPLSPVSHSPDKHHSKLSSAAVFVKKWQDLAGQKKGYMELHDDVKSWCYGATLPKDPSCTSACSWTVSDPSTFLIRGDNYLHDHQKIKATHTLMQMVGADWLRSDKREDDLGGRAGSIVQQYAAGGGPEFFFIVNIQVPGTTPHNLALYYMTQTPLEDTPLLERFVNGDDSYRNSRFKLIPYISEGSWIVKQSVGKKACLVGQVLEVNYFRGKNYLELGVNVGSSTVARGVVNLVLGYLNNLVIEMAFLIQGNTEEELPESLLGTCRLNHLDASKSVLVEQ